MFLIPIIIKAREAYLDLLVVRWQGYKFLLEHSRWMCGAMRGYKLWLTCYVRLT